MKVFDERDWFCLHESRSSKYNLLCWESMTSSHFLNDLSEVTNGHELKVDFLEQKLATGKDERCKRQHF